MLDHEVRGRVGVLGHRLNLRLAAQQPEKQYAGVKM